MARPAGFDREEAVQTAMQEIWRDGYESASVKAISEKLGITRSSYYNAFGSREALFKASLDAYLAQSPDRVLRNDLPDEPVGAFLTRLFRAVCAARAADPDGKGCLLLNSLSELSCSHENLGDLLKGMVSGSAVRFEEIVGTAVERGELPPDTDTHASALALQNLLIGLNIMSIAIRSEEDLWAAARATLSGLGLYDPAGLDETITRQEG